jgi:hypothetical protein
MTNEEAICKQAEWLTMDKAEQRKHKGERWQDECRANREAGAMEA